MSYNKTNWVDDSAPYITADKLNKIENGIETNDNAIGDLSDLTTTANTDLVSAVNELDSDKLDTTGTATNSTLWNGYKMDIMTANDTSTWIPVMLNEKMQHTTISSLVSRGDNATQGAKGLMSGSDKTKLDNMNIYSAHYAFGQTTEAYINVTGSFTLSFVYGLNGGSANFFGTNFHTDNAEVSQITGSAPIFSFINSKKIKIKTAGVWGQIVVISNNPITITAS